MSNNTIITIFLVGGFGLAGYFIYENYIKKSGTPPILGNTGGVFQSAANTVNNFLSDLSGLPSDLLNSNGGLNSQGIAKANSIMSNPLSFNDLMMQTQTNSILNGSGLGSSSSSSATGSSNSLLVPYPGVTPGINPTFGIGMLT